MVQEETDPIMLERKSPNRSATEGLMVCRYLFKALSPSTATLPTVSRANSYPWPFQLTAYDSSKSLTFATEPPSIARAAESCVQPACRISPTKFSAAIFQLHS